MAFHVIAPSLPGYGFSAKPANTGWEVERIAQAWTELMSEPGIPALDGAGGRLGRGSDDRDRPARPVRVRGIHLNMPIGRPGPDT